ncbi:MAG: phosphoenolpyruvate synthase [Gammaproteobacteria bacterium]|jgi:pyruvate,water dikinase
MTELLRWFHDIKNDDVAKVGGKNASLGEMIGQLSSKGIQVPGGFATTAQAFREFLACDGLDERIYQALDALDVNDVRALSSTGQQVRQWIMNTPFSPAMQEALKTAYQQLIEQYGNESTFAVRSSATAEDLPEASFAGQQETYLNISGTDHLLNAVKAVFASLFNDRAIAYRVHQNFDHRAVALSAGVQKMVRSDQASSGVMFSIDTESGFEDVVLITSAYGLGETVVQGTVNPDEFVVYKPALQQQRPAILSRRLGNKAVAMIYNEGGTGENATITTDVPLEKQRQFSINDDEILQLARFATTIEQHYGRAMDIEWAKDGIDEQLYIVQARPETVKSRDDKKVIKRYELKSQGTLLISGRSIGQRIAAGTVRIVMSAKEIDRVKPGDILVTDMTDPDWEPIMKQASAIVTNRGGRTCHAAIIAREMGIPAVVGCGNATEVITDGSEVTVSCAEGDTGYIYKGRLPFDINEVKVDSMPPLPFKIMMNVAAPDRAFDFRNLPNEGVGLARLEFIINGTIGVHPKALIQFDNQPEDIKAQIRDKMAGYHDPVSFYIEKLTEGIATIAAAFNPKPVIVRMSDFKSNEYANLIGGKNFEPEEENPMLGFRGASRYVSKSFRDCFELECFAIKKVRDDIGLTNVAVMIPFVRTVTEAEAVADLLYDNDLHRGDNGLEVIMMCEIPSNALLADQFLEHFDGFSIGSNDLTQLTLGLDRDSGLVAELFDERNDAVKALLSMAIKSCRQKMKYVGICGQGPSDHPDLAFWLLEQGIGSISLNPDSVIETWLYLAEHLKSRQN